MFMIDLLADQADRERQPLSDEERALLAAECTPELQVADETERRLRKLVEAVVRNEQGSPEPDYRVRTFLNAIEWVEPSFPYVAQLAVAVLRNTEVERVATTQYSLKGIVRLGILIAVIAAIIIVIKLVNR